MVGKSGNLRQASYARHLTSPRQCLQLLGRVPRSLPLFGKGRVNDAIPGMNLRAAARREHRPFRKNRKEQGTQPEFSSAEVWRPGGKVRGLSLSLLTKFLGIGQRLAPDWGILSLNPIFQRLSKCTTRRFTREVARADNFLRTAL